MRQLDVVSAFLIADMTDHEIYMLQPEGTVKPGEEDLVCLLEKSLYGIKQAPYKWHEDIDATLIKLGLLPSSTDPCLYIGKINGEVLRLCLYVDDILVIGSATLVNLFVAKFKAIYEIHDLGECRYFLGFEITRNRAARSLIMHHHSKIVHILDDFGMSTCSPAPTPFDPNVTLSSAQCPTSDSDIAAMKSIPYRAAVGRLLHISNITRPDIATAVGIVARFSANPGMAHWTAVKRILRYLKSSSKLGLTLGSPQVNPTLVGYADADHAGNLDSRRSTSGYFCRSVSQRADKCEWVNEYENQ
jgi:hypothetical protein